jgi:hypothetical protein
MNDVQAMTEYECWLTDPTLATWPATCVQLNGLVSIRSWSEIAQVGNGIGPASQNGFLISNALLRNFA